MRLTHHPFPHADVTGFCQRPPSHAVCHSTLSVLERAPREHVLWKSTATIHKGGWMCLIFDRFVDQLRNRKEVIVAAEVWPTSCLAKWMLSF